MNKTGVNHPPYDSTLKVTAIAKIRDEGMSVTEAVKDPKTTLTTEVVRVAMV